MGIGNVFNSTATTAFDKIGIANAFSEGNGTGNLYGSSNVILNTVSGSGNHYGTIFTDISLGTGDCYGACRSGLADWSGVGELGVTVADECAVSGLGLLCGAGCFDGRRDRVVADVSVSSMN